MSKKETEIDVFGALFVMECAPQDRARMRQWLISQIKFAAERSQRGPVISVVFDRNAREVGRNETGSPSDEARAIADQEELPIPHIRSAS